MSRPATVALMLAALCGLAFGVAAQPGPPPPGAARPPPGAPHPPPPRHERLRAPVPAPTPLQVAPATSAVTTDGARASALLPLERALAAARQDGSPGPIGAALLDLANGHLRADAAGTALPLLDEAIALANTIPDDRLGREAALAAAAAHAARGDRSMERTYLDQADLYRQRIASAIAPPPPPRADTAPTPAAVEPAAPAPGEDQRQADPPPPAPAPRWPWLLLPLSLVAVVAMLRSLRRAEQLRDETNRLGRHQRQLRVANSALQEQAERLRLAAVQDALTGAATRSEFARRLEGVLLHAGHYGKPVALMVFDMDHFKQINDGHGHLAGDEALKLVAGIVRENLGSDDLFGRFGGDEFLIGCADLDRDAAFALAERIRTAAHERAGRQNGALAVLTLSIGIAHADPGSGYALDLLFARADAALYAAKRGGRNRTVLEDAALPMPPRDAQAPRSLAPAGGA